VPAATTLYVAEATALVSDDVDTDTDTVNELDGGPGLMTP
jgi:hypothetical protein